MNLLAFAPPRRRVWLTAGILLCLALVIGYYPAPTALGILVALGGALALAALPEIAVYLVVLAVPFGSLLPFTLSGAQVTAADLFLALAWLLYLARGVARRRLELHFPPLALPFALFMLAAAVSVTVATSLTDSVTELTKWLELFAAYWLVAQFMNPAENKGAVERLVAVMLVAGLAQALLGIYQYTFRVGPEGFLLFGGTNLRAYGTFEQPNPYAGYLGLILPLALGTMLGIVMRRVWERFWLLGLAVISFGAMSLALFYSYSRGAWIGVTAGLAVTALVTLVRSRRALTLAFVLGAVALSVIGLGEVNVVPSIIADRFATVSDYLTFDDVRGVRANDENFAIVERRAHWQAALSMFEDSPWSGVGFGNYAEAYPRYALPKWEDPLGHAHNYYLNVLAEAGALGLITYLALWAAAFWQVGKACWTVRGWQQGLVAGGLGVLVALSIHNFFDNLFVHAMYIQVGLTLGLVQALMRPSENINDSIL